ncbi:hypothetical protein ACTJI8_12775 [Microbacterium sp. 22303]|uniref:hypothetical protein n=1 Tax=Microbacterium sp. 22303 TaxID=3453905 RepID=UPI003F87B3B0
MSTVIVTGTLTDLGLGALPLTGLAMRVRPVREAFGPDGLVSAVPVSVVVSPSGAFSMTLVPSGELTDAVTGRAGVDYVIEVGRFESSIDGVVFAGLDLWQFTAVAGGGNIGGMAGGSLLAVWLGPPWPTAPMPKGLYVDMTVPNDWGIVS